jgi:hypothetical protein
MKVIGQQWVQLTRQSLGDFLVNYDVDFDSTFGGSQKQAVDAVLLVLGWRPAEVKLWGKPPVQNPDRLASLFQSNRHSVHVRSAIDIPLDVVAMALGSKTQEAVLVVVLLPRLRFAPLCLNRLFVLAREGILQLIAKFVDLLMELVEEEGHAAGVGRALLRL